MVDRPYDREATRARKRGHEDTPRPWLRSPVPTTRCWAPKANQVPQTGPPTRAPRKSETPRARRGDPHSGTGSLGPGAGKPEAGSEKLRRPGAWPPQPWPSPHRPQSPKAPAQAPWLACAVPDGAFLASECCKSSQAGQGWARAGAPRPAPSRGPRGAGPRGAARGRRGLSRARASLSAPTTPHW